MRKQAIINLTEYYYDKNVRDLKKYTLFLVFFPILLTTFISMLRLIGIVSVIIRTFGSGFTLTSLIDNYFAWNISFNAFTITVQIFKSLCYSIYIVGIYGIVKYRQQLSFKLILDIFKRRVVASIVLVFVLGSSSWLIMKFPLIGGFLELIFTYVTIYAVIIYLENSNTIGIIDAVIKSIKFSKHNFIRLILFDIYYLFTPTLIGVSMIVLSQVLGMLTSLYLLSMFGVFIGSIGICRKLPKAFLAKVIYYLGNPQSH